MAQIARRRAGQATLEHLGIVLVVALVLAALAVWAARQMPRTTHPPALVAKVTAPLALADEPGRARVGRWMLPRHRGAAPIGRFLKRVAHVVRTAATLGGEGVVAFVDGFGGRVRERFSAFLRDPLGQAFSALRRAAWMAANPTGALEGSAARFFAYVRRLRRMPLREAYLQLSHDLERRAADYAIDRGLARLRAAALRRLDRIAGPKHPEPQPPPGVLRPTRRPNYDLR